MDKSLIAAIIASIILIIILYIANAFGPEVVMDFLMGKSDEE
jgi:hypothetical protein